MAADPESMAPNILPSHRGLQTTQCAGALSQRTMEMPFLPGDTIGIIALILSMPYRLPLQDDLQRCARLAHLS